jgi:hypothetical protein
MNKLILRPQDNLQPDLSKDERLQVAEIDKEKLTEAVEKVTKLYKGKFTHKPEHWQTDYEINELRKALSEPKFWIYCQVFDELVDFIEQHPKKFNDFENIGHESDIKETMENIRKAREIPEYQKYEEVTTKLSKAMLLLDNVNPAGRRLEVAATYARLTNIIFEEEIITNEDK